MPFADNVRKALQQLCETEVQYILVGGAAAVVHGAPVVTFDLDIVPLRSKENADRLLSWLLRQQAYHRFDLSNRRIAPTRELLLGNGHLNLSTLLGDIDVLCELEPGQGYEQLISETQIASLSNNCNVSILSLARIIKAKSYANRPKDRAVMPILLATLDEKRRQEK